MSKGPFHYDVQLLEDCATSNPSFEEGDLRRGETTKYHTKEVLPASSASGVGQIDSCLELFHNFCEHYDREYDWTDSVSLRKRIQSFTSNVIFVYEHNRAYEEGRHLAAREKHQGNSGAASLTASSYPRHFVALNKFSDLLDHELPFISMRDANELHQPGSSYTKIELEGEEMIASFSVSRLRDSLAREAKSLLQRRHHHKAKDEYDDDDTFSHKKRTEPRKRQKQNKKPYHQKLEHVTIDYPTKPIRSQKTARQTHEGGDPFLRGIADNQNYILDGKELWLEKASDDNGSGTKSHGMSDQHNGNEDDNDMNDEDFEDIIQSDSFASSLNWSTDNNPDGVGVVHDPIDQGACGSCWAIAATGTLEASISRRAAFEAFAKSLRETLSSFNMTFIKERATQAAQAAESTTLQIADLSIQELVDCDLKGDLGCYGGNPILAFFFIHKYGLTSTARYPYVGEQGTCNFYEVAHPIATVQSWGVLTPNYEANIELVLRYIGPVAVGVNGADPAFLAYRGGVFNSTTCSQDLNHAMLLVGYGEEVDPETGVKSRYWIARNSWGKGWGENGYARVARTDDGERGREGVCGIAQNPSVALGGALVTGNGLNKPKWYSNSNEDAMPHVEEVFQKDCRGLSFSHNSYCFQIWGLRLLLLLIFFVGVGSVVCLFSCFSGMKQRRRRRIHMSQGDESQCEDTALLGALREATYGSSSTA